MDTNRYLEDFYKRGFEDARLLSKHGSVEFLTTVRYVERYINHRDKVMEIGAGTGRYSHYFAQKGHEVDAVELIDHNIEVFKQNTKPGEKITITKGNALDLSDFPNDYYDITLLLGPLYHLYTKKDKLQAIKEAIRITKPKGIIFAAYCTSDPSILSYGFIRGNIKQIVDKGLVETINFKAFSTPEEVFELHRKEDIDELMADFETSRLHYIATDGYTNHMAETVDDMDEKTFELYLKYHFAVCERIDMVGLSHHVLDIFSKNME